MTMLFKHALIRLRAALSSPFDLALLVFSGLVTILLWPGLTDRTGSGWPGSRIAAEESVILSWSLTLLWLVLWPMIAGGPVRGQAVAGRRNGAFAAQAHPTLPIGPRSRIVSEALAVLAVVLIIRAPALGFGEILQALLRGVEDATPFRLWFLEQSVAGAALILPFLLLTSRPASSIEAYWLRSLALAVAVFIAMKLGLLETLPLCLATCGLFSALVLALPNREIRGMALPRFLIRSAPLARRFRSPEALFKRDLWLRPLPVAAVLIAFEVLALILDQTIGLPYLVFYFTSVLVFSWLLAFVSLQPMRSRMALAGIFCKPGFRPGDFAAACGVLPIRRQVIIRSVFTFSLVTTAIIWLSALGVVVLSAWFDTGTIGLVDSDGDPLGRILIPSVALIPGIAALVTCAVLGDRRGSLISGSVVLALAPIGVLLLILKVGGAVVAVAALSLATVAPLPAIKHLRAA